MMQFIKKIFGSAQERTVKRYAKIVSEVNKWDKEFSSLSDEALRAKTDEFKKRLSEGEDIDHLLPEAYGVVKSVCRRLVGTDVHVSGYDQKWDMIPYDVQVIGAIAMHKGSIAEMQTGEGKTLTATMPLYLNALTGKPTHLVTVNDYLCSRDCQWAGAVLRWLGLSTGVLTNATPQHTRGEIYKCDVVYGTASEFGFDYLRDNSMCSTKEEQVQRGYYFAIVDEIDSILIDEARTPLIISGPTPKSFQMYDQLKMGVSVLVKQQRDLTNKLASEANKVLEKYMNDEGVTKSKEEMEKIRDACHKLWIVSKGTPQNKILRRARENPDLRESIDEWDLYYHTDQNKEEKAESLSQLLMVVDEKGNEFELTDRGTAAWAEIPGGSNDDFWMLDLGYEYAQIDAISGLTDEERLEKRLALAEDDAKRKERSHNIRQLLRAHLLMEKDVDYIVEQDKIVIIDEHTGRPQPGRRFSDGLHQAIEAKEGVAIQKETQTYATVTLQNYFRMYEKLAGMTGTAITEASEFKEIYKLDVLQIPTYKTTQRVDANDEIYMTEREKYNAILNEIREIHEKGRPILIGTESVEVSEKLSRILKQNKIEHTVLNAKHNDKEAEIIADAGKRNAVTVSTNMAGRGTDIKLKQEVADLGGLHVIGTTRHQSRRIDRQLRGRSARLGDPGSSKFFISFEDQLMRLFASPRITALLKRFRPPEGEAISASILNRSIETAQKRVESRNYTIRKHTLEYDDVMNKQRQEIYSFRNDIVHSENLNVVADDLLTDTCLLLAHDCFISRGTEEGWRPNEYRAKLMEIFPVSFEEGFFDDDLSTTDELAAKAAEKILSSFDQKFKSELNKTKEHDPRVDIDRISQDALRSVIVRKIDELWQEHLLAMDHLRVEVMLRTVAQKDPLLEFKHEAFRLFHELTGRLKTEISRTLFRLEIMPAPPSVLQQMLRQVNLETGRLIFDGGMENLPPPINENKEPEPRSEKAQIAEPIKVAPKAGRNDPCSCGSGKKYKKCCGAESEIAETT
jgi:preprotein translocase subunit SecA